MSYLTNLMVPDSKNSLRIQYSFVTLRFENSPKKMIFFGPMTPMPLVLYVRSCVEFPAAELEMWTFHMVQKAKVF